MLRHGWLVGAAFLFLVAPARADDFRFKTGQDGPAELRYIGKTPVLTVVGTPEEIGAQTAKLAKDVAPGLTDYFRRLLHEKKLDKTLPALVMMGNSLLKRFPDDYRRELETIMKAYGADRDLIVVGNTLWDIGKLGGCSALIVEPARSQTGQPIFGRNFDFLSLGSLHQYGLVTIYKPKGKLTFASIGIPGIVGVFSGINERGLSIAVLDILEAGDGSPRVNIGAVPMILSFRHILEECSTVEEVEKILRVTPRTTWLSLAVCDTTHGAVFELTPKNVRRRQPECDICLCTNHFRTPGLCTNLICWRYALMESCKTQPKVSLEDVMRKMHEVSQGDLTIQTMVFEPGSLHLHVGLGKGPITAQPMQYLDLSALFSAGPPVREEAPVRGSEP